MRYLIVPNARFPQRERSASASTSDVNRGRSIMHRGSAAKVESEAYALGLSVLIVCIGAYPGKEVKRKGSTPASA